MMSKHPITPKFSALSEKAGRLRPGRSITCSLEAGWSSLLLQTFEQPACVEEFETLSSPDQLIVLVLKGEYEIESFSSRSWRRAAYQPGVGGLTAAMTTNKLRWHSKTSESSQILRLYIPQIYFSEVKEEYRRGGLKIASGDPDSLSFSDPVVFSVAKSLALAAVEGAPDLYAEAGARFLATHLLSKIRRWSEQTVGKHSGHELTDRRFVRVLEYMQHNFATALTLDQLAREAGISLFHFIRLFKAKMGSTPHQHIVQLRMNHAKHLLVETSLSVAEIAGVCGYMHSGHFAAAFQRHFCKRPKAFRRELAQSSVK